MVPLGQVEMDVSELLAIIRKRVWIILTVTILAGVISAIISYFFMTPIYQASTQILVNNSEKNQENGYRITDIDRDLKLVETYSVIIKSPRIMDLVLQQLGLTTSLDSLTDKVSVSRVKNSQVISITVQDKNHEQAVKIANTIAEVFRQQIFTIMNVDNVQILAIAKIENDLAPVKPKPLINIVIAVFVGMMISTIIVFLLEYFDKYFHSEREVERILRLSVLGSIPVNLESHPRFEKKSLRQKHIQQAEQEVAVSRMDKHQNKIVRGNYRKLETVMDPSSAISEAYRTLRTNIQFCSVDREIRTLLVTNSGPGKGKPTTIANLAIILAQTGKRVLLIDADMRHPNTHLFFRLSNEMGLSNLLARQDQFEEVIQETFIQGLYLLPSGPIPPNPAELLSSQRISEVLQNAKHTFDYILIDTPPVVPVTDAQVLATKVDGVLLVIHAGKTDKVTAKKAKILLEKVYSNILGVILNDPKKEADGYY